MERSQKKKLDYLNPEGLRHYEKLQKSLMARRVYSPLQDGLLEMAARLYAQFRDPQTEGKERMNAIKIYQKLIQGFDALVPARDNQADDDEDLEGFIV